MDVVVVDGPVKFGMLLSWSWVANLKGTLQMDMSYDTILVFGEQRRLYTENRLAYMISSPEYPEKHPIYSVKIDLGSTIFCNDITDE
jgi:ribonuclease HI